MRKEKAFNLFMSGMSITKSAKEAKVGERTLSNLLKSRGIDTSRNSRKYRYDEEYFKNIDTEEKAYWLGFIYADGCVRHNQGNNKNKGLGLEIILNEEDREHLVKFAKCMNLTDEIVKKKTIKLKGKEHVGYRVVLNSTKMCKDLIENGVTLRKSLTLTFPTNDIVNDEMMRHFVRGYFEGDGNVGVRNTHRYKNCPRVSVLGTDNFLTGMKNLFETKLGVTNVSLHSRPDNKVFSYQKSGDDARAILRYMYDGASIYLDRKYKTYEQICRPR